MIVAHLDPVGTLVFVLTQRIGWAKPVPVDERYLKHPRQDMMWIALAGPASNVIAAFVFGTILRIAVPLSGTGNIERTLLLMLQGSVIVNLGLAAFNMIPIFPLDGSRILTGLLSREWAERYRELDHVGPFLLLGIVVLGMTTGVNLFSYVVYPVIYVLGRLFTGGML